MNQNDSLKWYQDHTEEFIARTADVDMTAHYRHFLEQVVPGGHICVLSTGNPQKNREKSPTLSAEFLNIIERTC